MASSKSMASPALLFLAVMALVLAASAQAPAPTPSRRVLAPASAPTTSSSSQAPAPASAPTTSSSSSQASAPAPSQGSCPPGFKNYLDLTNTAKSLGKNVLLVLAPTLTPVVGSIVQTIPHTGITLCLCVQTNILDLPIQCVSY
ncbi:hypothetical protein ACP70R_017520 [Stipagrostis hirtigluma subsp. patula]